MSDEKKTERSRPDEERRLYPTLKDEKAFRELKKRWGSQDAQVFKAHGNTSRVRSD